MSFYWLICRRRKYVQQSAVEPEKTIMSIISHKTLLYQEKIGSEANQNLRPCTAQRTQLATRRYLFDQLFIVYYERNREKIRNSLPFVIYIGDLKLQKLKNDLLESYCGVCVKGSYIFTMFLLNPRQTLRSYFPKFVQKL